MRRSPQFSFWIPVALAKIDLLFPHSHKRHKTTCILVGQQVQIVLMRCKTLFLFQASQSQIEEAMRGMMESKNRLAFEKGSLQVC